MNSDNKNNLTPPKTNRRTRMLMVFLLLMVIGFIIYYGYQYINPTIYLDLGEFSRFIEEGKPTENITKINSFELKEAGANNPKSWIINGTFIDNADRKLRYQITISTESMYNNVIEYSRDYGIPFTQKELKSYSWIWSLVLIGGTIVIVVVGLSVMSKRAINSNNKAFDFAKSKARRGVSNKTFNDVAGLAEEKFELEEIIDFLKYPQKYKAIGARVPKGVLLIGPPGTGKTLMAKAVAGEAKVPFFYTSGSEFVEMFVGVGASRIREMFKDAKRCAPCVIFIDELDAVGRQRGAGLGGGHDEKEQTLNQLLAEMDGFEENQGIIILAATNRVDVLDPALLRPGRFDRQITIGLPDVRGRHEILKIHARNKKLAKSVNLENVARRTPWFSGAQLENLMNEAALLAAREGRSEIQIPDIDEAYDRVLMGPAKKSRRYIEKEKRMVAYHEAGHAVVGILYPNANAVEKVTIVPRGMAGGYNLMLPEKETYFQSKKQLLAIIVSLLGGRIAEEIMTDDVSTGAHNDFERATEIARSMVTEYGMSRLGPIQYEKGTREVFLGRDFLKDKNFSDQVALEIDQEVRRIIDECYIEGKKLLNNNIPLLKLIAETLVEIETLTKQDIEELHKDGKIAWYEMKKAEDKAKLIAKEYEENIRKELKERLNDLDKKEPKDTKESKESKESLESLDSDNKPNEN